jgi:hypothetical protein
MRIPFLSIPHQLSNYSSLSHKPFHAQNEMAFRGQRNSTIEAHDGRVGYQAAGAEIRGAHRKERTCAGSPYTDSVGSLRGASGGEPNVHDITGSYEVAGDELSSK